MRDVWMGQLSAYLDGELGGAARRQLEGHLETCQDCRTALAGLEKVRAWAEDYEGRPPEHDGWPQVEAAIRDRARGKVLQFERPSSPGRRVRFGVPLAIAASIALLAVAGGSWWLARATAPTRSVTIRPMVSGVAVAAGATSQTALLAAERYGAAIAQLEHALLEGEDRLDAETVRIVREKMVIVDRAIADARNALVRDPGSSYVAEHFAGMLRRKLMLLRNAATAAPFRS
jgi:anti-sigma factor RsiW